MELRIFPPLVAFEINFLLSVFALVRLARGRREWHFAGFALAASAWSLGAMLYFLVPESARDHTLFISFAGGNFAAAVFAHFSISLSGGASRRSGAAIFGAFFAYTLLAGIESGLALPGRLIAPVEYFKIAATMAYFSGLYLAGFLALFSGMKKMPDMAPEFRFLVLAAALPFAGSLVHTGVVWAVPHLPRPNILLAVVLGAEFCIYYHVRFKRLDIDELLTSGLLYLVYTIILTGIVSLGLFLGSRLLDFEVSTYEFLALVGIGLASAFAFVQSRERIQEWIDREFFPEKVEYRRRLEAYEEELREARERIRRAERLAAVGELSAKVAHEIKNPLGPIKGYAQLLIDARESGGATPEMLDKGLRIIAEESEKIDERVRGLLDLARRDPGETSEVEVHALIERTLSLLEISPRVRVTRKLSAADTAVEADADRLQGAIYNLLQNAVEAMGGAGEIEVATRDDGDSLVISVSDSGPGIPQDLRDSLFEPFRTGKKGGTGLGLAVARTAAESFGGTLDAANGAKGAKFEIRLPALRPRASDAGK